MADPKEKLNYSKEEYLMMEEEAEYKSEFYNGEIFAMAGGSLNHSIICFNLYHQIAQAITDKDCIGFDSNMKLEISEANAYLYPDVTVVCGDVELSDGRTDIIRNPVLVVEVLSPGTQSYDRGKKFEYYRMVGSIQEYVLVSQEQAMIEIFYRQDEKTWLYSVVKGLDETVFLRTIDYRIPLKDVYRKAETQNL
jgi:Uma2 family endonuclease